MKKRLLSAAVGISLLLIVLCFYQTYIFNAAISIVSALTIIELNRTAGLKDHKLWCGLCVLFALWFPFSQVYSVYDFHTETLAIFILLLFVYLVLFHARIRVEALILSGALTIAMSWSLAALLSIRDYFPSYNLYYILLIFVIAWVCDAGAYFVGRAIGRHKMAPRISPNKTIEGAVGGILVSWIVAAVLTLIFQFIVYKNCSANCFSLLLVTVIGSFIAILGDLDASVVKRQFQIKDFGKLLPGHGGAMDRFDSMFFVVPFFYLWIAHYPILGG